jgi:excisionase family DNA binding protein
VRGDTAPASGERGCSVAANTDRHSGGTQIDLSPGTNSTVSSLLDANGAAALLNVPATWVLAEARADRIPHVRLGRYVRFDAAELQIWWLSRRRGPWRSRGAASETARGGAHRDEADRRAA